MSKSYFSTVVVVVVAVVVLLLILLFLLLLDTYRRPFLVNPVAFLCVVTVEARRNG